MLWTGIGSFVPIRYGVLPSRRAQTLAQREKGRRFFVAMKNCDRVACSGPSPFPSKLEFRAGCISVLAAKFRPFPSIVAVNVSSDSTEIYKPHLPDRTSPALDTNLVIGLARRRHFFPSHVEKNFRHSAILFNEEKHLARVPARLAYRA